MHKNGNPRSTQEDSPHRRSTSNFVAVWGELVEHRWEMEQVPAPECPYEMFGVCKDRGKCRDKDHGEVAGGMVDLVNNNHQSTLLCLQAAEQTLRESSAAIQEFREPVPSRKRRSRKHGHR